MSASAPRIGFDRFLALDWVTAAMRVRAGMQPRDELLLQLDEAGLTPAARKKTLTLLNRLWLEPREELSAFSDRGIGAWKTVDVPPIAIAWGMTVAAYPFFAKVAELVGRLTALQGDCRASEIHRRMEELFGQREGTRRMTNMALQTQAEWGAIKRTDRGRVISRGSAIAIDNDRCTDWLLEGALRYLGRPVVASTAASMPVLYPFAIGPTLAAVITKSSTLELRYHGPGEQVLALSDAGQAIQ